MKLQQSLSPGTIRGMGNSRELNFLKETQSKIRAVGSSDGQEEWQITCIHTENKREELLNKKNVHCGRKEPRSKVKEPRKILTNLL